MNTCTYDPRKDTGLGMYHCPECGEMVIAGTGHLPAGDNVGVDDPDRDTLDCLMICIITDKDAWDRKHPAIPYKQVPMWSIILKDKTYIATPECLYEVIEMRKGNMYLCKAYAWSTDAIEAALK